MLLRRLQGLGFPDPNPFGLSKGPCAPWVAVGNEWTNGSVERPGVLMDTVGWCLTRKAGEHQDIAWNLLIVAITQLTKHLWDSEHPEWSQGDRMCWRTVCLHFEPLEEFLLAHLHVKTYLSKFLLLWFKVSEISLPLYLVTLDLTEVSQLKVTLKIWCFFF